MQTIASKRPRPPQLQLEGDVHAQPRFKSPPKPRWCNNCQLAPTRAPVSLASSPPAQCRNPRPTSSSPPRYSDSSLVDPCRVHELPGRVGGVNTQRWAAGLRSYNGSELAPLQPRWFSRTSLKEDPNMLPSASSPTQRKPPIPKFGRPRCRSADSLADGAQHVRGESSPIRPRSLNRDGWGDGASQCPRERTLSGLGVSVARLSPERRTGLSAVQTLSHTLAAEHKIRHARSPVSLNAAVPIRGGGSGVRKGSGESGFGGSSSSTTGSCHSSHPVARRECAPTGVTEPVPAVGSTDLTTNDADQEYDATISPASPAGGAANAGSWAEFARQRQADLECRGERPDSVYHILAKVRREREAQKQLHGKQHAVTLTLAEEADLEQWRQRPGSVYQILAEVQRGRERPKNDAAPSMPEPNVAENTGRRASIGTERASLDELWDEVSGS